MLIKLLVMHHLHDDNDLPGMERFFWRYHAPEVMQFAPKMTRYVNFRAVPPPRGAEEYGYYNYHLHENCQIVDDGKPSSRGLLNFTAEHGPMEVCVAVLPLQPTEDFFGADLRYDEKTILRWVTFFRYPDGVRVEEGEKWFMDVHAKEAAQQPGLIRFFSYRTLPGGFPPPQPGQRPFTHPNTRLHAHWHRVSELWYENNNGWRKSILESPPPYTKPAWATWEKYPFVKPREEFASTFILERPTDDYLRDLRPFYF